jgi:periplasmic protein TonB
MRTIALLESERHHDRSGGGSAASILLHVALVGLAMIATTQARNGLTHTDPIYIPLRFQPQPPSVTPRVAQQSAPVAPTLHQPMLSIPVPTFIPTTIGPPPISPDVPVTIGAGTSSLPSTTAGNDSSGIAPSGNTPFLDLEVDVPASVLPGQRGPVYPEGLRMMGVEGRVFARFVIEKNGRVETEPTIVSATAEQFSATVKRYLSSARYRPATKDAVPVRQLAEQEFVFTVRR